MPFNTALLRARFRAGGLPGWLTRLDGVAPEIDFDFQNNRFWSDGAEVDIADILTCTRASPATVYYEQADGSLISFSANELRYGNNGLLCEAPCTNILAANSHRDLTNGAWSAANVTALKDQTGNDGSANGASSITATANNGTILQARTLASSSRVQTAYVKRISGTGTLEMTTDGGSTWITPTLVGGAAWTNTDTSYRRIIIPAQTVTNPSIGFRIGTSGDSFAVDFVQNETGPRISSPVGGGETRSVDVVTGSSLVSALTATGALTLFGRVKQYNTTFLEGGIITLRRAASASGIGDRIGLHTGPNSTARPRFSVSSGGTASVDANAGTLPAYGVGVVYRLAGSVDASSAYVAADNVGEIEDSTVTLPTLATLDTLDIGHRAGNTALAGYIERITAWTVKTTFVGGA